MHLVELGLRSGAWMDAVNAEGDLNDGPSGEEDFQPTLDEARDLAGPIGWLVLGWIFVLGLAGCSVVAILALRKLRPPSAARTWSWDEA